MSYICYIFSGNTTLMDIDNEDSMDAPSVSSTDGAVTPMIMSTPVSKKVNNIKFVYSEKATKILRNLHLYIYKL